MNASLVASKAGSSKPPRRILHHFCAMGLASAAGTGLMFALHTRGHAFRTDLMLYFVWIIPLVVLQIMTMKDARADRLPPHALLAVAPALLLLSFALLSTVSSATQYRLYYFSRWLPVPEGPWFVGVRQFAVLWALLTPLMLCRRAGYRSITSALMLFALGCAYLGFQDSSAGHPINNFDHSSMIFRLWQFARTFPRLSNYVPAWNGGVIDTSCTMSGVAGLGLVAWPFWHAQDILAAYSGVFHVFFTLGLPLLSACSLLMIGARWEAACIAAVLSISPCHEFSLWTIQHGTVTSSFTMSFALPFSACLFRIVWLRDHRWRVLVPAVVSGFLLLVWPPNALVACAIAISCLISYRAWRWKSWARLSIVGLVLAMLLFKWVLAVLFDARESTDFLLKQTHIGLVGAEVTALGVIPGGMELLAGYLRGTHPLVAFLGIAGSIFALQRSVRRWFGVQVTAMMAVVLFSIQFPNLQLWRFINVACLIAVAPAAILLHRILRLADHRLAVVRAAILAMLLATGYQAYDLYARKTPIRYTTFQSPLPELMRFFREDPGPSGRVMFVGRSRSHFGHSWVACLPVIADREMMAVDYYNFPLGFRDVSDYPPLLFRQTPERLRFFIEAYNVRYIVAHDRAWLSRLLAETQLVFPVERAPAIQGKGLALFETYAPASWFFEGEGSVVARCNAIDVALSTETEEGILKYNWQDGLQSEDKAVEIRPREVAPGITLIGFRTSGPKRFRIVYSP